jgi:hypothetical protein
LAGSDNLKVTTCNENIKQKQEEGTRDKRKKEKGVIIYNFPGGLSSPQKA